jgi:DNA-binding transcriptional LysR family regulator
VYRDLDIRPLRTLVTIVEAGGFRRAAGVLNISQPAVSQHIRRLEALIGEPVFRKRKQLLELSPAGEELLRHARKMVRANDELVQRLSAQQRRKRLTLSVCETLVGVVPGLLGRLEEHIPLHRLTVSTGTGSDAELSERLNDGAIDIALRLGDPHRSADRVIAELTCAWFGRERLLANQELPIAVLAPRQTPLRKLTEDTLATASIPWHVAYQGVGVEDVVRAIELGIGVSMLFTTAEQLWNLPPVPPGLLPNAIRRVPVVLSTSSRLTVELARAARKAAATAVAEYALMPDLR